MADLGAIGFSATAPDTGLRGGVVSGQVTAAGGASAAGRVVTTLDRTAYPAGVVPVFGLTVVQPDGSYAFAGMDASFSAGPRQYLVMCLEDAAGYPSLLYDKVTPV